MGRKTYQWSQEFRNCKKCGRLLEPYEVCECESRLPRDGLRARCPRFVARASYKGGHYLCCGKKRLKFSNQASRDGFYMEHCCGAGTKTCPTRGDDLMKGEWKG